MTANAIAQVFGILVLAAVAVVMSVAGVYWPQRAAFYQRAWGEARAITERVVLDDDGDEVLPAGYRLEARTLAGRYPDGRRVRSVKFYVLTPFEEIPVSCSADHVQRILDFAAPDFDEQIAEYRQKARRFALALARDAPSI